MRGTGQHASATAPAAGGPTKRCAIVAADLYQVGHRPASQVRMVNSGGDHATRARVRAERQGLPQK
jgi:hypothetical protein